MPLSSEGFSRFSLKMVSGQKIHQEFDETFVCPLCMVENRADAKFCRRCGKPRAELNAIANSSSALLPADSASPTVSLSPESSLPSDDPASPEVSSQDPNPTQASFSLIEVEKDMGAIEATKSPVLHALPECPTCFTALRIADKFCSWCGEAQPIRVLPDTIICPGCETQLPPKANYCFACGRHIGSQPRLALRLPTELFKDEDSELFPLFDA
jgi:predicted amidophosphoribosyltransferase